MMEICKKMELELPDSSGMYVDRKALVIYVKSLLLGLPWNEIPDGRNLKKKLTDSLKIFAPDSSLKMEFASESAEMILATIIRGIIEARYRARMTIGCGYSQPDDLDCLIFMDKIELIQLGLGWLESDTWASEGYISIFGENMPVEEVKRLLETSLASFQQESIFG